MLGNLPDQAKDFGFDFNGFKCWLGVDENAVDGYVRQVLVAEKAKGGGKYGQGDYTTWQQVHDLIDADVAVRDTYRGDTRAFMRAFLVNAEPKLAAHVGFGGSQVPPFPSVNDIIGQLKWVTKYAVTFNATTGKFTVV